MPPKVEVSKENWHISKSIPIAVVIGVIAQIVLSGSWIKDLSAKVDRHETLINELRANDSARRDEDKKASEAIARLDERIQSQMRVLERLERALVRQP